MSGGRKAPAGTVTPLRPRRPCPECDRPSAREFFPFCSARCKDVDLHRWLSGAYAIPVREDEEESSDGKEGDDA